MAWREQGTVQQCGRRTEWRAGNQACPARHYGAHAPRVGEERTPCALPTLGIAPAQRHAQQGRHTDCHG